MARLAEQVAKLSKNSSNSSQPPSSDIVKPQKPPIPDGRRKRRIGGQPGNSRHERQAFSARQIDEARPYAQAADEIVKRIRDEYVITQWVAVHLEGVVAMMRV